MVVLATAALFRCSNESPRDWSSAVVPEASQSEKRDPCAAPANDPTVVQTSTAMIQGWVVASCLDQKKRQVKRKVFIDGTDTDHVTFEPIYVSQGHHVVKLEGNDYTPPCQMVTIEGDGEQRAEFTLVGGK